MAWKIVREYIKVDWVETVGLSGLDFNLIGWEAV